MPMLGNDGQGAQPSFASLHCACNSTMAPYNRPEKGIGIRIMLLTPIQYPTTPPEHAPVKTSSLAPASCVKSLPASTIEAVMPRRFIQSHLSGYSSPTRDPLQSATLATAPPDPSMGERDLTTKFGAAKADITRRLGIVLDAMRNAGFQDFDAMVVAYYTAQFERSSFPALLQCASRSRRLKPMLQELQDSSRQWPRWESRGLNESISAGTALLCVEEMDLLNKRKELHLDQSEPASLINALESHYE
ncbi:hypothetical protein PENARI_c005G04547 [Penicillium arizonense]|uniref:Uncharacterized protein n=1 Tax=Penicillium arizonense TaxID=1835702 RepID=A0A1F5LNU1_PENAI|nr:hypothetical protein PENARI_c005G04547 [Penicillium arizonense]OGE54884.1 hypothetical protein PENARI_c005G04547 [Penicillium arizonense]